MRVSRRPKGGEVSRERRGDDDTLGRMAARVPNRGYNECRSVTRCCRGRIRGPADSAVDGCRPKP